jgi:hypothetical protein
MVARNGRQAQRPVDLAQTDDEVRAEDNERVTHGGGRAVISGLVIQ